MERIECGAKGGGYLVTGADFWQNAGLMRTKIILPALLSALAVCGYAYDVQQKYAPCIDYNTRGESRCGAPPSLLPPVSQPVVSNKLYVQQPVQAPVSQSLEQRVDQYLENYGKPPREFVEFYLDPTPENARKWVVTYDDMLKKGQNISNLWSREDASYQQALATVQATGALADIPKTSNVSDTKVSPEAEIRIGGLANAADSGSFSAVPERVHITYFFSKTCPYCAKMTPQLSSLFNDNSSKLAFTCVDVTPLSSSYRPEPSNIEGQLPCQWRLPLEGEVERLGVRQTPTLFIEQKQGDPLKLSGFIPADQLKSYIFPANPAGGM